MLQYFAAHYPTSICNHNLRGHREQCYFLIILLILFLSLCKQQVFHLHILLGVQDLLCVWFYVPCVHDSHHRNCVCHYCVHLFPS